MSLNSRLTEILELAGKASGEKWTYEYKEFTVGQSQYSSGRREAIHRVVTDNEMRFPICNTQGHQKYQFDESNFDFIAQSRTLIPQLVEALKLAIEQRNGWTDSDSHDLDIVAEQNDELEAILRRV